MIIEGVIGLETEFYEGTPYVLVDGNNLYDSLYFFDGKKVKITIEEIP